MKKSPVAAFPIKEPKDERCSIKLSISKNDRDKIIAKKQTLEYLGLHQNLVERLNLTTSEFIMKSLEALFNTSNSIYRLGNIEYSGVDIDDAQIEIHENFKILENEIANLIKTPNEFGKIISDFASIDINDTIVDSIEYDDGEKPNCLDTIDEQIEYLAHSLIGRLIDVISNCEDIRIERNSFYYAITLFPAEWDMIFKNSTSFEDYDDFYNLFLSVATDCYFGSGEYSESFLGTTCLSSNLHVATYVFNYLNEENKHLFNALYWGVRLSIFENKNTELHSSFYNTVLCTISDDLESDLEVVIRSVLKYIE